MRTLFFSLLLFALFRVACAQPAQGGDFPASCHAAYAASPDSQNPMIFHFQDQSTGQINHWQWSFGDGATSSVQNPVHTYAAGGTFFVCLTVSDSDSANICHDMICLPVTVHQPGTCVADFTFTIDSLNTLQAKFTDKSTGNINNWHWDFGDGTASPERNPHHNFPAFGKYKVCLTAFNGDSISVCNDVKCDTLTLAPNMPCHASFIFELDSLNHTPNTFKFRDASSGNPNHYQWVFDDGGSSPFPNISHQFHIDGVHKVCLQISREIQGVTTCVDSSCRMVHTARYFDLGGHLFAGAYPINNPVSTGDTGLAYLYRKEGAHLIPYDTLSFTNLGYYAFPRTLNGSYVLRAALSKGSAHYAGFFPSYYPQIFKWQDAAVLNLADSNDFNAHVYLLPVTDTASGPGSIRGKVIKAGLSGHPPGLDQTEVILYSNLMVPLKYAITAKTGQFELNALPYGAYYLYVESPGKYSRLTAVWLEPGKPVADSVLLEVFTYDVTGIPVVSNMAGIAGELFPNPASDHVTLEIHLHQAATLTFEIRAMTGQRVTAGRLPCRPGDNLFTIPVNAYAPGVYLFTVSSDSGERIMLKKLIKY
ncbi:MAG: PKD domain-containing protein [Bacteroidota bacterium]